MPHSNQVSTVVERVHYTEERERENTTARERERERDYLYHDIHRSIPCHSDIQHTAGCNTNANAILAAALARACDRDTGHTSFLCFFFLTTTIKRAMHHVRTVESNQRTVKKQHTLV